MKKKCEDCYFYGNCDGASSCSDFIPIENVDKYEDKQIRVKIRWDKKRFEKEWKQYANEYK